MENLIFVGTALIIVAGTFIADRLIRRAISRYAKRLKIDPHASNILQLIFRIIVFSVARAHSNFEKCKSRKKD